MDSSSSDTAAIGVPFLEKLNNYGLNGLNRSIRGNEVQKLLSGYANLVELMSSLDKDAVVEPMGAHRNALTHKRLREFVSEDFRLEDFGIKPGSRVGVVLPNGPEMAVVLFGVISRWCAAPVNITNTWEEMKSELLSTKAVAIIILTGAIGNDAAIRAAEELSLGIITVTPAGNFSGLFHMKVLQPVSAATLSSGADTVVDIHRSGKFRTALVLHTSGTSGNKKLVPYTLDTLMVGVGCIISSWALQPKDVCLNMMPLFHIGGIVRNVLAPLLSGGSVICCGGFDPLLFWDTLLVHRVTWYYASPTMHHAILNEAANRPKPLPVQDVRYVANAAGGLLPVLAEGLRDTFYSAAILTSYGMTECMPVSSPPQDYRLDPTGTSGIPCGPELLIVDDQLVPLGAGIKGNILIRGPPCFAGYENPDGTLNQESFFAVKGHGAGWFNTGDMGGVDEQGYLYISGRTKEIINRGGETISPFEIEEAVVQHPFIKEVLAFAAPHEQYQETIGVVVVTQKGKPRVDLPTLHTYLDGKLHRSKWPQAIVYSDSLPKNATGKILRIKFAERTRMKPVDEEAPPHTRLFEMECPELGAPLNQAIALTPVKRDLYKTFTHLLTKKDVVDVAVVIMNLAHWQSAVVAFVVLDESSKISAESLRDGCVLHLDQYEVPQFLYQVKEIPYLPPDPEDELLEMQQRESMSGKESGGSGRYSLSGGGSSKSGSKSPKKKSRNSTGSMTEVRDAQAKKIPGQPHARDITLRVDEPQLTALAIKLHAAQHVVPPRTPIEVQVELVWRSVLQLNGSGIGTGATALCVTTSFFDMGGDSLKAGQLVNVMRKRLQVHLTVADLFTAPTIEKISQKIATLKTLGTPDTSAALKQSGAARQREILRERGRARLASNDRSAKVGGRMRSTSEAVNEAAGESTVWLDKGSAKIINTYGSINEEEPAEHDGLVDQRLSEARDDSTVVSDADPLRDDPFFSWDFAPTMSSTSLGCLLVQALPITLIYPLRRIVIWFLIAGPWVLLMKNGWGRFNALLVAMVLSRVILGIFAPLTGILCKWLIIGQYKAGRYPLWGSMYLRWWIVEQIVNIMGKGYFRDDLPIIGPYLVRTYYSMMGAKIGRNVSIHKDAKLGQADLLTIGDNVAIDNATIRPFSIEEGHFVLLPITIKRDSCIGLKCTVHAGAVVPANTYMGPLTSSHETSSPKGDQQKPANRRYCRPTYTPPPAYLIILLGIPILALVTILSSIPWFLVLKLMVSNAKRLGWYKSEIHSIYRAFLWWITPQRLFYFFLLRIVKRCFVPFIRLGLIICIKRFIVGEFTEMSKEEKSTQWNRFRYWLMQKLLPGGKLAGVTPLVGTHYEIVSIIYRLLGAKVGERVYWPGSGLEIVEYDLLEVGDDVVFGSRSVVITSSTVASRRVVFESGSMIADRCVVLPGVTVKKGAVLGSGSLAPEGFTLPVGSVWVGSQDGCAVNVAPEDKTYSTKDTVTPFGRAFYQGKANFSVVPLWGICMYNTLWQAFCTCYRNCYTPVALILCSHFLEFGPFDERSPVELFQCTLLAFMPLHLALSCTALLVDIAGKWALLGQREQGEYAWDQSSYCQRWQMYLTLQEIRRGERHKTGVLDMIQGSQYLVWYFRALGSNIGNNVCLYPNGGDPMMTEPDLVTIEDFAAVDDASLIAHINTRGIFRLNPLFVGMGCVLKSNTRVLSGASMDAHSVLLEHTLVMAGEVVDCGAVWQGWPASSRHSLTRHRAEVQEKLGLVSRAYLACIGGMRSAYTVDAIRVAAGLPPLEPEMHDGLSDADEAEAAGDGEEAQLLGGARGSTRRSYQASALMVSEDGSTDLHSQL